jgi:two-component system sensor histidine kinase AtoS
LQLQLIQAEKIAAIGSMAAFLAHEMHNSITSVQMITQVMLEEISDDSHRESLSVTISSLNRMEKLVADLLNFARPRPLEKVTVSIEELLESVTGLAQRLESQGKIRIKIRIDDSLPQVKADVSFIRETLLNLVLNAVHACNSSGSIEITASSVRLKRDIEEIDTSLDAPDDLESAAISRTLVLPAGSDVCQILVEDDGPGMSDETLHRMFDPFYTTRTAGTGLGLSFVKRIVNAHGGIVEGKNRPGGGAQFTLIIPWSR